MIIRSYGEWRDAIITAAEWIDCPACTYTLADASACTVCSGDGEVPSLDGETAIDASRSAYFEAVISDIRKVCVWTRRDFLGEVGPFVREFRGYGHQQERSAA